MEKNRLRFIIGIFIIAWGGFVIAAYFAARKPLSFQLLQPLAGLFWSMVLTGILTANAIALGRLILGRIAPNDTADPSRIILAGGIGLGALGLLGFGLAIIGTTSPLTLLVVQLALLVFLVWRGETKQALIDFLRLLVQLKDSAQTVPAWMKWAAALAFALTFLRTLLPPIEAFDALLYHLTIPDLWIRDGGLRAYNFPHYWFPGLVEGVFLWGLGLGSEIVTQQMHFSWTILLALLLWHWARSLWGDLTAWWGLMLLISMPSLLLLASWAYTDLALTFYGLAALYCIWRGIEGANARWWIASGVFAGFAMGIKYTSFVIPVSAVVIITIVKYRQPNEMLRDIVQFSIISILTGSAWYIRNWIWMSNPFYPFAFGGRYWDPFRAAAFAGIETGIGWNWQAILSLPLTITLGHQDVNYFDGNIGPLFLVSLPLALFLLARLQSRTFPQRHAMMILFGFSALSSAFWVYGYATTKNLWQTRLLLPALIPFIVISAAGLVSVSQIDTKQFRASFILYGLGAFSIFLTLFDATLGVIIRNPLATATGIITRDRYFETFQPAYFAASQLVAQLPDDAKVYSLFEPRSYGLPREVQPDTILDQFPHDLYTLKTPEAIVRSWQAHGYTHILLNIRGADFVYEDRTERTALDDTLAMLDLTTVSPEGEYAVYRIPSP